jgi:propanol-preferring alcohol dehydrogenase
MLAARLHAGESRLRLERVPVPEPGGDQVLVRVAGAGLCRSDLHILDGLYGELVRRPVTMGHEIAGWVEALGPDARDIEPGEPVTVMVGWGCGHCEWCVTGHEQICPQGDEAGATVDGGFADYVLVPHRRHVVPLGDLDPVQATPLGCAGITAYAAVSRVRPVLEGASAAVVIGAGGLGQYAVQLLRRTTGGAVIALDNDAGKRDLARELGADHVLGTSPDAAGEILALTDGRGAPAVIDFVGSDETLALAADAVARRGLVALIGLAGGSLPFTFFRLAPEASLTTVVAGGVGDLQEVVRLARSGALTAPIQTYPLERIDDAIAELRSGSVAGRAVLTPLCA